MGSAARRYAEEQFKIENVVTVLKQFLIECRRQVRWLEKVA